MVAPTGRRPDHSRRAQYGNFFRYLAALAGIAVGAILLIASLRNEGAFAGARTAASDVTVAPAAAGAATRSQGLGLWATIQGYFIWGNRVARLEREVAEARVRLAEQAALREENGRLKALLHLSESDPKPVAVARLIGSSSSSSRRFATLSVGSTSGVQPGMAVRSPLGLVGRVIEVGRGSARVLLITDGESTLPVRRASDGLQAYATGRADGTLQIRMSTTGINPFHPGDAIVTSGSGGVFRPNVAVAVVAGLTTDGAIARPLADPGLTEFVTVEPVYDQTPALPDPAPPAKGKN